MPVKADLAYIFADKLFQRLPGGLQAGLPLGLSSKRTWLAVLAAVFQRLPLPNNTTG
jgi:hypothetical protein